MKASNIKSKLQASTPNVFSSLYDAPQAQCARYIAAIDAFSSLYDKAEYRELSLFSVPGRSEISGNHTDHQHGRVLAGAINRDILAVAAKNDDGIVRLKSEGYDEDAVSLAGDLLPEQFEAYTSRALIAGTCDAFRARGYRVGGFDAYTTTEVLKGSGISSSAAFEVMIGNILNHLYNEGKIPNEELAMIAQYAENKFFKKPCGLMDQMACAVGGFVYIDFEHPTEPKIEQIPFSLSDAGYLLCIVNTGGNHADLNEDYASVPKEMCGVAACLGQNVLRPLSEEDIFKNIHSLREKTGDRAILRAIHFMRENERVLHLAEALRMGKTDTFLQGVLDSGNSSFRYLQNVYTNKNINEQGLSLALALTEGFLADKKGAWRVHGGGFAGTIQAFVPKAYADNYRTLMNTVFGDGAVMVLSIRESGAIQIHI